MDGDPITPTAPVAGDVVEIIERLSSTRVTAVVESVRDGRYALRFERATTIPDEARVRWFDGDTAWQALSHIERIDETRVSCRLAPAGDWEPAAVRRSLRAPVDNSPMLVRIVSSSVLAKTRRLHVVCLDISASGCRSSWSATPPRVGDAVDVAWDVGDWNAGDDPAWIPAQVARVISRPFGARQVGFKFDMANAAQAAHIRAWHQAWLQEHRCRSVHARQT